VVAGGLACILGAFLVARAFPDLAAHELRLRPGRDGPTEARESIAETREAPT
jgi:hypothetical protein